MLRWIKTETSMQFGPAFDRTFPWRGITPRMRMHAQDEGLLRHNMVAGQSKQGVDIAFGISEIRPSKPKMRVGVKVAHGSLLFVRSDCDP